MQFNSNAGNIPMIVLFLLILPWNTGCQPSNSAETPEVDSKQIEEAQPIKVGAQNFTEYLPLLAEKQVGMVVNHSSIVGTTHLVDTLISLNVNIKTLFAPEHGFRGDIADGETIKDGKDQKTALTITSLYGKNKKPTPEMLQGIDILLFDIQDVGARFYTFLSTMHYVMEAAAENNIPLVILDRPNPNGHYVDGPVMEDQHKSFVGMHSIPIVHGMTLGELALMINGEGWLKNQVKCDVTIIPVENWDHEMRYTPALRPSPNLPNERAVNLYPSLCLFEQTIISVGRGTDLPFTRLGHPDFTDTTFAFVPKSRSESKYPKYDGERCYGTDLMNEADKDFLDLSYLISYYEMFKNYKEPFFKKYFARLAGTDQLQQQIEAGLPSDEIRKSWQPGLNNFKLTRKKYLLYKDFE